MKKLTCIFLLSVALAGPLFSQDRDSLLRRINEIKKDTDRYLYGLSTVPGDPNPEASREQAAAELKVQVEQYLDSDRFVYLREKKDYPAHIVESVTCLVRPNTYRTIVYLEKARLQEVEKSLSDELDNEVRRGQVDQFVNAVLAAQKINDVLDLIAASPLSAEIKAGQKIDNETQQFANDGLLVFFDPKSKKILEVMTPMDQNYVRRNAVTGEPANPIKYKNAPLWVYVEGLKNSDVL